MGLGFIRILDDSVLALGMQCRLKSLVIVVSNCINITSVVLADVGRANGVSLDRVWALASYGCATQKLRLKPTATGGRPWPRAGRPGDLRRERSSHRMAMTSRKAAPYGIHKPRPAITCCVCRDPAGIRLASLLCIYMVTARRCITCTSIDVATTDCNLDEFLG